MALDCPSCKSNSAHKLIGTESKIYCNLCYERPYSRSPHFGRRTGEWGDMTWGKAWEIDNTIISPDDGRTSINKVTGQESQY